MTQKSARRVRWEARRRARKLRKFSRETAVIGCVGVIVLAIFGAGFALVFWSPYLWQEFWETGRK